MFVSSGSDSVLLVKKLLYPKKVGQTKVLAKPCKHCVFVSSLFFIYRRFAILLLSFLLFPPLIYTVCCSLVVWVL